MITSRNPQLELGRAAAGGKPAVFMIELRYGLSWCRYGASRDRAKLFASEDEAWQHVERTSKLRQAHSCGLLRVLPLEHLR